MRERTSDGGREEILDALSRSAWGIAAISWDVSAVVSCPSTNRLRAAQMLTEIAQGK